MKCIRIFPETCAKTRWPLANSTRNMALGKGSTTVPSTEIASSFAMRPPAVTDPVRPGPAFTLETGFSARFR